ncbi:MAG: hypothetical protein JRI36_04810 [Deltaproteobacteria bacterium]|nr:hypothetical protein [Deltaproteobacteria bacterium]
MKKLPIILLAVVAVAAACFAVYRLTATRYEKKLTRSLRQARDEYWDKIGMLEKNVAELQEELSQQKETILPKERLEQVYGETPAPPGPAEPSRETDCTALEGELDAVFSYLDKKAYVRDYALPGGTATVFNEVVRLLTGHLPLVSGEMKDMVSLTRNVAHFFRTLGKDRIDLLKDIMANENDIVEPMTATFFSWFLSCEQCGHDQYRCPSLEVLYQYAGFFLNTLAGKSYLLRRDSKLRVLVSYYCVLILDKANEEMLNRHGIDIRDFIYYLFQEISSQKGLVHKKAYLDTLKELRAKYHVSRGQ